MSTSYRIVAAEVLGGETTAATETHRWCDEGGGSAGDPTATWPCPTNRRAWHGWRRGRAGPACDAWLGSGAVVSSSPGEQDPAVLAGPLEQGLLRLPTIAVLPRPCVH